MKKERPARIWILDPSIKAGSNLLSILIAQISEFLQKKAIPLPKKPHLCIPRVVENLSPARIQILDLSIKAVINLLSILTAQIFAEFLFWDPHAGICWNLLEFGSGAPEKAPGGIHWDPDSPFLPGYALGSANNPQCGVRNPLAVKVPVDPGLERRNSASRGQEDLCYVRKNQGEEKQEGPEPFPAQL